MSSTNRVLIGEVYLPLHRLVAYYGNDLRGAQMPFNFALLSTLWSARSIEKIIADYEKRAAARRLAELGARQSRPAAGREPGRAGTGARRRHAAADTARHADAVLRRRDRHAPGSASRPIEVRDPFEKNVPGIGVGRDGCRTPMQWERRAPMRVSRAAAPWLPLAIDSAQRKRRRAGARHDVDPELSTRQLIALRRRGAAARAAAATSRSQRRATCCSTAAARRGGA